jgi:hypothetical protein
MTISTVFHSYPRISTVRHTHGSRSPHHTTTVVPVGCGECVVETRRVPNKAFTLPHSSTVRTVVAEATA